jgi:hypothetical protein
LARAKTKSPRNQFLWHAGFRTFMKLRLSPETPLSRDVAHTTRSVVNGSRAAADARTTARHHLATGVHWFAEYRLACEKVKHPFSQSLDAAHRKK